MAWADDLSNSMGMNVTPYYTQPATASGGAQTISPAQASSNFERIFESQQAEADRDYELKKKSAKQKYETELMSARTSRDVAKANERYQQAQTEIARERLAFDRESLAQNLAFNREQLGENRRQFDQNFGLNQAKLGYDVLGTAAQLRGPENWFQSANYMRGAANDPNTSTFLNALKSNIHLPDFGAQYGVPDPETLSTLTSKLGTNIAGGMSSSVAPGSLGAGSNDTYLNNIRGIYSAGAHRLGAGALENLTDAERKLLTSGIDAIGGDSASFMDMYRRSRVGQGLGNARAA